MKQYAMIACVCVTLALATTGAAYAGTVVVSPSSMGDWAFLNSSPDGVGEFVTGPGAPPLGVGSLHLSTGTHGDERVELRNTSYAGTKLSDLTSLSYSTYVTSNNGQQFPYIFLNIDTDGNGSVDDILGFEPPYQTPSAGNPSLPDQGDTAMNTWQVWDALGGGWWSSGGYAGLDPGTGVQSLAPYLAAFPDATIVNSSTGLGGVRIIFGWASPEDRFDGYVDAFTIGTAAATTTYDFEPGQQAVPEPMTIFLGIMGLGSVAGFRRLRK